MSLLFDIGFHKGGFTEANLHKYDKIIGIEANPYLYAQAKNKWDGSPKVTILNYAVSDKTGTIPFYIASADTISTISPDWINKSRFSNDYRWNDPIDVPTTTLDELIKEYGAPEFIKIDVESAELEVVLGLSQKVPALAFEWAEESQEKINKTVEHLQSIGFTEFGSIDFDDYLGWPAEFKSWEELKFNENIDPERKDRWGMLFCR